MIDSMKKNHLKFNVHSLSKFQKTRGSFFSFPTLIKGNHKNIQVPRYLISNSENIPLNWEQVCSYNSY